MVKSFQRKVIEKKKIEEVEEYDEVFFIELESQEDNKFSAYAVVEKEWNNSNARVYMLKMNNNIIENMKEFPLHVQSYIDQEIRNEYEKDNPDFDLSIDYNLKNLDTPIDKVLSALSTKK